MSKSEDHKEVSNNDLHKSQQFAGGFINADNVNAHQIGGDIINNIFLNLFFGKQELKPAENSNSRTRILKDVKFEVVQRLNGSLHNSVLINLEKKFEHEQVFRPWDPEIKVGLKPPETISKTTTIVDIFNRDDIDGKLLILGAPGSGKTTTLLELAQFLVQRAQTDSNYPIPVLFNLSSWKDKDQSLIKWLVNELDSKYGVRPDLGKNWAKNEQLLLLLDGLDELEPVHQEACVQKINQFLCGRYRRINLVICSRSEEYNSYESNLKLNGAIYLKPLTNSQIEDYLTHIGTYIDINTVNLWWNIKNESALLELVRTPLLLSIIILVFQKISMSEWQKLNSNEKRLDYLIHAYVLRMLRRRIKTISYAKQKPPSKKQTQRWLIWLAQQMQRESISEFLIERMQPNYLGDRAQIYQFRLLTGLVYGLFIGLIGLLSGGLVFGLVTGICGGFIGLVTISLSNNIETFEILQWSWERAKIKLVYGQFSGLLFGLVFGVISQRLKYGLLFGLNVGLIIGLIVALSSGLKTSQDIKTKTFPNQGISRTLSNAIFIGLISGLIGGLIGMLFNMPDIHEFLIQEVMKGTAKGLLSKFPSVLLGGIIGLLASSIACGGGGCIEHFALRFTLYFNRCIPWNYACFLNYATERLFLQRIGGRYRFIHKMLQDHLASHGDKHPNNLRKDGLRFSKYPIGKSG